MPVPLTSIVRGRVSFASLPPQLSPPVGGGILYHHPTHTPSATSSCWGGYSEIIPTILLSSWKQAENGGAAPFVNFVPSLLLCIISFLKYDGGGRYCFSSPPHHCLVFIIITGRGGKGSVFLTPVAPPPLLPTYLQNRQETEKNKKSKCKKQALMPAQPFLSFHTFSPLFHYPQHNLHKIWSKK